MIVLGNLFFGKRNIRKIVVDDKPDILPDLLECEVEKIFLSPEISQLKDVINFSGVTFDIIDCLMVWFRKLEKGLLILI